MTPQQYCLRWKHHHSNVQSMFAQLLEKERFCDVTLYCSPNFATQVPDKDTVEPQNIRGVSLRAHRVVLAACSELLGSLLGAHEALGEPVLVIDGAEPRHLKALLDFMYTGEMNVHHSQLASLLKTAEELRIKGLTDIRWNNKDEPPDCTTGAVTTVAKPESQPEQHSPKCLLAELHVSEPRSLVKRETGDDRVNVNGGPPPLIKLPTKEKVLTPKRENSESESSSPKRRRVASGTENTDDESNVKPESENMSEWQHGSMNITAERVVGWGSEGASRDGSDEEWGDAPADIGSFLHTRLQVDGDNSNDESSSESILGGPRPPQPVHIPIASAPTTDTYTDPLTNVKSSSGVPKSDPRCSASLSPKADPRFSDVVKLCDYLQHGRRPQFWEEHYVKRVMEAVRLKELEMKQAAEILGVSYGTLYGRYRDVYGCINRPYRAVRDFWQVKGPSEVLERLQRGEISLAAAAGALGVSVGNLAAHVADFGPTVDFDPIPIEVDPSLRGRPATGAAPSKSPGIRKPEVKLPTKKAVGSSNDEEPTPGAIVQASHDPSPPPTAPPTTPPSTGHNTRASAQKFPSIRVANIESLRCENSAPSASALMKNRPDLTIVAKKQEDDT